MRISQQAISQSSVLRLNRRLEQIAHTQSQLGTGRRILTPSDDPAGSNRLLAMRSDMKSLVQESRNAEDGKTWVDLADSKLQGATQLLQRVRDLAIGGSSSRNPSERGALADEISEIRDELAAIANSKHLGRGLFAGYAAGDAVAYDAGTSTWGYTGTPAPAAVMRRISQSDTVQVNVLADDAFGFSNGAGADVFSVLDRLAASVRAGDLDAVGTGIGEVDGAIGDVLGSLSTIGATQNRIDHTLERNLTEQLSLKTQMSSVEDVDLAETIVEMETQQTAYQATLGALARAVQPSLMDFLR